MNCLEFRQLALADPYDPALLDHVADCAKCTSFRQEILDMDSDLEKAFAIPVPEGLAARVLLNQSLSTRPKTVNWVRYGMAASFAAALVLAAALLSNDHAIQPGASGQDVTSSVTPGATETHPMDKTSEMQKVMDHGEAAPGINPYAAHASHQPHDFYGSEHQPIDDENLERLMGKFHLTASIDHVVYAAICPFQGENAVHLVIKDGSDQYTVMLLPDHSPGKMYTVDDTLWRGYVSPHPAGALAVLAEADDTHAVNRIREISDKVQSSIYLTAEL